MIKTKNLVIELDQGGLESMIDFLFDYLINQGVCTGGHPFAKEFFDALGFKYKWQTIRDDAAKERKKHIDWMLGRCEDDGIKRLSLPKNDVELRYLLENFDNTWCDNDYGDEQ